MISHITCFFDFAISLQEALESFWREIFRKKRLLGIPQEPLGQNCKIEKTSYVRNHVSFHLRPVPSKNIENWRRNSILSVDIFEKKYFLDFGKSPISTPDFQNFIFWIKKYYPKDHYKTIVAGFGSVVCMWQWSELKIDEKWESHGTPPPLRQLWLMQW